MQNGLDSAALVQMPNKAKQNSGLTSRQTIV
jgi:hypothetical protein